MKPADRKPGAVLTFRLNCVPTAQARPRHMRTKSGISIAYKSERQVANEATLEALLAQFAPEKPLGGGLGLLFTAVLPVPASAGKRTREAMLDGEIGPTVKPDLDNLAKQLKDCMTRLRFWNDDRQVVRLECEKIYGEEPCWMVAVERLCGARR